MVATTAIVTAASAAVTVKLARMLPKVHADPRIDAGIKGAAGLVAIVAASKLPNAMLQGAVLGAGVGLVATAAGAYVPFLA